MHSYSAWQGAGPEPAAGPRGQVLAALSQRIADRRADTSLERDPDFIRRVLPAIAAYTSYFTPEVRRLDRVPVDGPALLVGNHSGLFYMPEVWTCGQAILERRGIDEPAYVLAYDLLFAMPGVGPFLRRLGAVPASTSEAEPALARGACVLVYPGGDREACRPWTQRNEIDFDGRTGFVRLALRCGVPVIPVVAHGGHHAVVVLARGERLSRAAGLGTLRVNVFPILAGPPFGVTSILTPPPPLPAHLTVEFLPALDWTGYGPGAADDTRIVSACYEDITGRMQAALDRLSAEYPHPVLLGCSRITARAAARAIERARSRRHRPGSWRLPDPEFQVPHRRDNGPASAPFKVPVAAEQEAGGSSLAGRSGRVTISSSSVREAEPVSLAAGDLRP